MSSNNGHQQFDVVISRKIASQIKALAEAGIGNFVEAFQAIHDRLRRDPEVFGEPRYGLKHLDLQVRIGIILPRAVMYSRPGAFSSAGSC